MSQVSLSLVSVYDKTGIAAFAKALHERGVSILSTGGTARLIREAGVDVGKVSDHTGFPEILDGRVKTLHPRIHGGILARRDLDAHMATLKEHSIPAIDLVCVNLYPFADTIAKEGTTEEEAIEQIDIGGPCMLRAAAKSHRDVLPLVDPADYAEVLERMDAGDLADRDFRRRLAAKAFAHTAVYDAAVSAYFGQAEGTFPRALVAGGTLVRELRYGENPHQKGALYTDGAGGIANAEVLNGKAMSYCNIGDAEGAWLTVRDFEDCAAVVVKHANPCGAALAETQVDAFRAAWDGDPISAFGGILAFNRKVEAATAEAIAEPGRFVEVIVAPDYESAALEILKTKPKWGKNVRILKVAPHGEALQVRRVSGGWLVQEEDTHTTSVEEMKVVTERSPTDSEARDLAFAQRCCKHVKSNSIVLVKDQRIVGVGAGQMSRVDASKMAVMKAGEKAKGSVFASDAFLPFNDALEVAVDAGATAAVQPGGSRNDEKCIEYANAKGLAMVFTGHRHFLH